MTAVPAAEIALCARARERSRLQPRVILLVGTLAIERLWGRVPLGDVVGTSRIDAERVLIPLPHPSGASRWLNDPRNRHKLRRALAVVRRAVEDLTMQAVQ